VLQIVLPVPITVGKVTANVVGVSLGQKIFLGMYDPQGKKVLDAVLPCDAARAETVKLSAPVDLGAGTYFYAFSASDPACKVTSLLSDLGIASMLSRNGMRLAAAQHSIENGTMPAVLGSLAPDARRSTPLALLER
jgi:hypothetical protein